MSSNVVKRAKHGVTIVELLIVIAVLGVLLALSLPALRGMRSSARNVAAEATIRQHSTLIGTYVQDFKDTYPWLGLPNQNGTLTLFRQTGEPFTINYFETCSAWPSAMTSYYGDLWASSIADIPRAAKRSGPIPLLVRHDYRPGILERANTSRGISMAGHPCDGGIRP
jgi:prepilin-type N-terminal cleavage/methylation domain-containing protein